MPKVSPDWSSGRTHYTCRSQLGRNYFPDRTRKNVAAIHQSWQALCNHQPFLGSLRPSRRSEREDPRTRTRGCPRRMEPKEMPQEECQQVTTTSFCFVQDSRLCFPVRRRWTAELSDTSRTPMQLFRSTLNKMTSLLDVCEGCCLEFCGYLFGDGRTGM